MLSAPYMLAFSVSFVEDEKSYAPISEEKNNPLKILLRSKIKRGSFFSEQKLSGAYFLRRKAASATSASNPSAAGSGTPVTTTSKYPSAVFGEACTGQAVVVSPPEAT